MFAPNNMKGIQIAGAKHAFSISKGEKGEQIVSSLYRIKLKSLSHALKRAWKHFKSID